MCEHKLSEPSVVQNPTVLLSPFDAEREKARTAALSFDLWRRKTSWVESAAGIAFIGLQLCQERNFCRTNGEESQVPSRRHIHGLGARAFGRFNA